MPVTGARVFKYTRLLRTFLKPLQVDTPFLGYSNLFATIMCIKTFVVHLNCMQYFCNLCVCVFVAHTCVCTVETPNQHCYLLHSLCTYSCLSIHSFIYLFVCLLIIWLWVFYLYVYLCNTTFRVRGGQKKASDTLELELQAVVSLRVGSRNQTQVL